MQYWLLYLDTVHLTNMHPDLTPYLQRVNHKHCPSLNVPQDIVAQPLQQGHSHPKWSLQAHQRHVGVNSFALVDTKQVQQNLA